MYVITISLIGYRFYLCFFLFVCLFVSYFICLLLFFSFVCLCLTIVLCTGLLSLYKVIYGFFSVENCS